MDDDFDDPDAPTVLALEDTEPVDLQEVQMPRNYLVRARKHLGGRWRRRPAVGRGTGAS